MDVLGTGLSGLVGTRVVELLPEISFRNFSLETGFDITDRDAVREIIGKAPEKAVLHMAAYTDVDGAEKEKQRGKDSISWKVNVEATRYITEACRESGKRLIYISTDFVFDGSRESYCESDSPDPVSWYGRTKYEGEKLVAGLPEGVIVRISYPYRAAWPGKPDFVHRILERLKNDLPVTAVNDQVFVPTLIDDIAKALSHILTAGVKGVIHVTGSQALSPFDAAIRIARTYGVPGDGISPVTASEYFRGRAPRPFHAVLVNATMTKSGIRMSSFDQGLQTILAQENGAHR